MIDTNVLLLTMLFGFLISIITFTVKSANIKITGPSFTINRYAVIGILVLIFLAYDYKTSTYNVIDDIGKIKYQIIIASVFTIFAALVESYLFTHYEVTHVAPVSIAWALIFIGLIGKIVYKEKITKTHCAGYALIVTGILTLAYSNSK